MICSLSKNNFVWINLIYLTCSLACLQTWPEHCCPWPSLELLFSVNQTRRTIWHLVQDNPIAQTTSISLLSNLANNYPGDPHKDSCEISMWYLRSSKIIPQWSDVWCVVCTNIHCVQILVLCQLANYLVCLAILCFWSVSDYMLLWLHVITIVSSTSDN